MKQESYKLFIGFRKLGEFYSIREAKLFAQDCDEHGIFNLIGTNYSDTWYQPKPKKYEQ